MKGKTKRKFTADFKLKIVLEVLKEKDTLAVISKRHELHPNQISDWKKQFMDSASTLFEAAHKPTVSRLNPMSPCFMSRSDGYRWSSLSLKKS